MLGESAVNPQQELEKRLLKKDPLVPSRIGKKQSKKQKDKRRARHTNRMLRKFIQDHMAQLMDASLEDEFLYGTGEKEPLGLFIISKDDIRPVSRE